MHFDALNDAVPGFDGFDEYFDALARHSFERLVYIGQRSIEEIKYAASVEPEQSQIFRNPDVVPVDILKALDGNGVGGEKYGVGTDFEYGGHCLVAGFFHG